MVIDKKLQIGKHIFFAYFNNALLKNYKALQTAFVLGWSRSNPLRRWGLVWMKRNNKNIFNLGSF